MDEIQIMEDYWKQIVRTPGSVIRPSKENLQATLVKSCRAKLCMWLFGKGTKPLPFKKSNRLRSSRSVTMQICPRKSKQSRRWMHRYRFSASFCRKVCRARSSILAASRYF